MPRFLAVLAVLTCALVSCTTVGHTSDSAAAAGPGDEDGSSISNPDTVSGELLLSSGALRWKLDAAGPSAVLRFENRGTEAVTVRVSVPSQKVGTRTQYEERYVGVELIEFCDPVTQECYLREEPIYEMVLVKETVYADVRLRPRRLSLQPGASGSVEITRGASQADLHFVVSLQIIARADDEVRREIAVAFGEPGS